MPKEPSKKPTRATTRKVTTAVRKPRAKKVTTVEATHEHIAMRAYFLHLEDPYADPAANWLQAEKDLLAV